MHGKTPLHYAAGFGCPKIIKLLVDNGAELDVKDNDVVLIRMEKHQRIAFY